MKSLLAHRGTSELQETVLLNSRKECFLTYSFFKKEKALFTYVLTALRYLRIVQLLYFMLQHSVPSIWIITQDSCLYSFTHACTQSSRQPAVQPAQALSQSRWVVQTDHRCSRKLWPATVPAAPTPSSCFLSFARSLSHAFLLFLLLSSFTPAMTKSLLDSHQFLPYHFHLCTG